jgi:hypothetical protein
MRLSHLASARSPSLRSHRRPSRTFRLPPRWLANPSDPAHIESAIAQELYRVTEFFADWHGEAIVQDGNGASDFESLSSAMRWRPDIPYAFDLMHLNGRDPADKRSQCAQLFLSCVD